MKRPTGATSARWTAAPYPMHVDIPADAKTLTLITTDGGDGDKQGDHSTWADAKLLLDGIHFAELKVHLAPGG